MTTMLRTVLRFASLTAILLMLAVAPALAQSLVSDQEDYEPGSIATFTGAGFAPGEEVHVHVGHADGTGDTGSGHDEWSFFADEAGGFVTTWLVCTDDCAGSTLRATAHGVTSDLEASCIFTDTVFSLVITSWTPMGLVTSGPLTVTANFDYSTSPTVLTRVSLLVENVDTFEQWNFPPETIASGSGLSSTVSGEIPDLSDGNYQLRITVSNLTKTVPPSIRTALVPEAFSVQLDPTATPPSVTCAGLNGARVNTTGQDCSAVVDLTSVFQYGIQVSGNPPPAVTFSPPAGSVLPVGMHTITVTAANGIGPDATCSFELEVRDQSPPQFQDCASPLVLTPNSGCDYVGTIPPPTVIDNCGGPVMIVGTAPPTLLSGSTQVTWTATDNAGNQSTCVQDVVVEGGGALTLACAGAQTVGTNTGCAYVGALTGPTMSGGCGGPPTIASDAPAEFPLGATTVTWTASDETGVLATCAQVVTVVDDDPPTIAEGAPVTFGTSDGCSHAAVLDPPAAADNCAGPVSVTSDAPASFPIGETVVTWTATDAAGNTASSTQVVNVVDDDAPTLACAPAVTLGTNDGCSYTGALEAPSAADNCAAGITIDSDAPGSFPLGATTVNWTATDAAGNNTTCSQVVTVVDDDAPVLACPANASFALCEPVDLGVASASDNCAGDPVVANNAPGSFPVGSSSVTWIATDAAGNAASCTQLVQVTYGAIDGFLPPLLQGDLVVNVKRGRTVPVKFRLAQCPLVSNAVANISLQQLPMGIDLEYTDVTILGTGPSDGGTLFRATGDGQYMFNLATSNLLVGKTYRIRATLLDGQVLESLIQVLR